MTSRGRWGALASRLHARWRGRAVVLAYHRVASPATDPWSLAVTPEHFAEHLQVLARRVPVVPLSALSSMLAERRLPRRCVAVTFDDGYADNLHTALPALAREEIPATVFVVAGALGGRELWWDRLARLLLSPGALPERPALTIAGEPLEWMLGQASSYEDGDADRHRAWRAGAEPPTARHAFFLDLWRRLQSLPESEREECLARVAAWAGGERGSADARTLTASELGELSAHPLIDVGGHTVTHPRLSTLAPAEQEREITEGKRAVEAIVGRPLGAFAYPYGRPEDFTADSVRAVARAGFRIACANFSGSVGASTDPYRLPRAYVHDCDGSVFEERLEAWLATPPR